VATAGSNPHQPTSQPANHASLDGYVGLADETFTFVLDDVLAYKDDPKSLTCTYTYDWNFVRSMGSARFDAQDDLSQTPLPIIMNPTSNQGMLSFMGADNDQPVKLPDGTDVIVYRVWLNFKAVVRWASLILGEDGDTILPIQSCEDAGDEIKSALEHKKEGKAEL